MMNRNVTDPTRTPKAAVTNAAAWQSPLDLQIILETYPVALNDKDIWLPDQ